MNGARANLSIYPRLRSWGKRRAQQHRGRPGPEQGEDRPGGERGRQASGRTRGDIPNQCFEDAPEGVAVPSGVSGELTGRESSAGSALSGRAKKH